MIQAFYTGLSGLASTQSGIDVTSNNIANINTVGFLGSTAEFSSLFEGAMAENLEAGPQEKPSGMGVKLQATAINLEKGVFQQSDNSTDLAINGDGWFGIQSRGNTTYTRAGIFQFDANRDLVTPDGAYLLGTLGENINDGVLTERKQYTDLGEVGTQKPLSFPNTLTYPAEATTLTTFSGNIGIDNEIRKMSSTVFDTEGNKNHLELTYTKKETQPEIGSQWDITATVTSPEGTIFDTQTGEISFNSAGALQGFSLPTLDNNATPLDVSLGTPLNTSAPLSGFNGVVSIAANDLSANSKSNGLEKGELINYSINDTSDIVATFSNGRSSSVGKVAVFHFQNEQGLTSVSGSKFQQSSNSGDAFFF
jgi:flagellar hook protein FlgE